jgi:hypothetical protein
MVSAKKFGEIALSMTDTDVIPHFDKQAFRKNKKIFASVHPETLLAMVKLTPEQQSVYLQLPGNICYAASGAWGRSGCTLFNLENVHIPLTRELIKLAWSNISSSEKS